MNAIWDCSRGCWIVRHPWRPEDIIGTGRTKAAAEATAARRWQEGQMMVEGTPR
jgi:predicted oxidoreductase